jgi:hypothetical protein
MKILFPLLLCMVLAGCDDGDSNAVVISREDFTCSKEHISTYDCGTTMYVQIGKVMTPMHTYQECTTAVCDQWTRKAGD